MADIQSADVVVVGAGMGGLVAALAAQEDGARVLLVEKAPQPGGTMAISGGYVWTVPTLEAYLTVVPHGDPALGRMLVEDFEDAVEWLREHGGRLGPRREGIFGHRVPFTRGYRLEPDPVTAGIAPLVSAFERGGGALLCGAPARGLLCEDGDRVAGVRVRGRDGPRTVRSRAVVLATGGFQGDVEMTTRYLGPWADRLFLRANPRSTGDGLRMALAAGAATSRGLRAFYGHLLPAPPAEFDLARARGLTQYYSAEVVLLNLRGERFVDESAGDDLSTQALAREPEARGFLVFDEACYREHVLRPQVPDLTSDPLTPIAGVGGVVLRADTVVALAGQLAEWGVPASVAQATLEQYDVAIAAGTPERLPVARRAKHHRLCQPPFYAVPVRPGLTFTHGGVRINTACQALDRDGQPVPGLFVAGVDAGGIFYEGYVGALAASLVTGLRAGVHAARAG